MRSIFPTLMWWTSASVTGKVTLVDTEGLFQTYDPKTTYICNFSATSIPILYSINTFEKENIL